MKRYFSHFDFTVFFFSFGFVAVNMKRFVLVRNLSTHNIHRFWKRRCYNANLLYPSSATCVHVHSKTIFARIILLIVRLVSGFNVDRRLILAALSTLRMPCVVVIDSNICHHLLTWNSD